MKCIIAGSRRFPKLNLNYYKDWHIPERRKIIYNILEEVIKESGFQIDTVISGCCWGIDQLGEEWAKKNNMPIESAPAEWEKYGKWAGFKRNGEMAEAGDCLICIYTVGSSGSNNMIESMKKLNKPLHIRII